MLICILSSDDYLTMQVSTYMSSNGNRILNCHSMESSHEIKTVFKFEYLSIISLFYAMQITMNSLYGCINYIPNTIPIMFENRIY